MFFTPTAFFKQTVQSVRFTGSINPWATTGNNPYGIAIDSSGNVYTANYTSNTITKVSPSGAVTASWASTGNGPYGIAIDSSGNVYTTNTGNNTITKVVV